MVTTPQRKERQRLNTRSSNSTSDSNSVKQGSSSRFEHAAQLHHPPPPHQVARKRNRASRNGNTDNDDSREMYEGIFDTGMREEIDTTPEMWIQTEFEVSSVRGEMVGPHYERKESTWLQLPQPSRAMSRLESSIYDQFIKKIPQDSEWMYDPTLRMPISDTVPLDAREWVDTSSLDRSRTVTRSRFVEGAPSSHPDHEEDGEIDVGRAHSDVGIMHWTNGGGDGNGSGKGRAGLSEWGKGGLGASRIIEETRQSDHWKAEDERAIMPLPRRRRFIVDDDGEKAGGTKDDASEWKMVEGGGEIRREEVVLGTVDKRGRNQEEKEERVWKKPKGGEALKEYSNRIATAKREAHNLYEAYLGFLLQQHEKFRLSFWPEYVPHKCQTCDIAAKELGPFQNGILSRKVVLPKEFAIVQDGRKRKRTKEMMDKLKDLVEWHKSNFDEDGSDP